MARDPSDIRPSTITTDRQRPARRVTVSYKALSGVVLLIVLCALSFLGGVSYEKTRHPTTSTSSTGTTAQPSGGFGGQFGGRRSFNRTVGQVTAISDTSITIEDQTANTAKTFSITSSTQITDNGQTVTASSVQVGDTAFVVASTTDSSQAARIIVNPGFGGGGGNSSGLTPQAN